MALRKLTSSPLMFAFNRVSAWQLHERLGVIAGFVPRGKVCISMKPDQQYSRRHVFTEEELVERSKFLASKFRGSESEMHRFLTSNQQLVTMGREKFYRLTELLAEHGIIKNELFTYPNIYRRKYETVASRIRQLEEGNITPVTLRMINTTYRKYQTKYGRLIQDAEVLAMYKSSMNLLSSELGFTETEAEEIMDECMWLSNTRLSTLKEKIELLRSYGVSSEAIKERVWVLAFPSSTIRSRMESMKQSGLSFQDFPKSYLIAIKSSDDNFKKFLERLLEDKAILDQSACTDKTTYICSRLSCSEKEVKILCRKFPALLSVRLPKLKANLDVLLHEFGVAPLLIRQSPRMLGLSTETLRERLELLQERGIAVSGKSLTLTNRDFERYISKFVSM